MYDHCERSENKHVPTGKNSRQRKEKNQASKDLSIEIYSFTNTT